MRHFLKKCTSSHRRPSPAGWSISNLKGIYLSCPDVMNCLNSSQRTDHDGLMSFTEDSVLVMHVGRGGLGVDAEGVDRQVRPKLS